jgi:hypothetical protein
MPSEEYICKACGKTDYGGMCSAPRGWTCCKDIPGAPCEFICDVCTKICLKEKWFYIVVDDTYSGGFDKKFQLFTEDEMEAIQYLRENLNMEFSVYKVSLGGGCNWVTSTVIVAG